MKHLITAAAMALAALAPAAFATSHKEAPGMAAAASAPMGKQQSKMGACSTEFKATGKPGAERQAYMKDCLKKDADTKTAQQSKMTTCSAEFKTTNKPGAERQAYMKECLAR